MSKMKLLLILKNLIKKILNIFYRFLENKCYIPFIYSSIIERLDLIEVIIFDLYDSKKKSKLIRFFYKLMRFILRWGTFYFIFFSSGIINLNGLEIIHRYGEYLERQELLAYAYNLKWLYYGVSAICFNKELDSLDLDLLLRIVCMIIFGYIFLKINIRSPFSYDSPLETIYKNKLAKIRRLKQLELMKKKEEISLIIEHLKSLEEEEEKNPDGKKDPNEGKKDPNDEKKDPNNGKKDPNDGKKDPNEGKKKVTDTGSYDEFKKQHFKDDEILPKRPSTY